MSEEVITLRYQETLKQEQIDAKSLPTEIKNQIKALTPLITRYNNKPSENMKDAIILKDIEIANMIIDHVEKDLPDEEEFLKEKQAKADAAALKAREDQAAADEKARKEKEEADAQQAAQAKIDAENEQKAAAEAEEKAKADAIVKKETDVMAIINSRSDKRIPTADLAAIIGEAPSKTQVVGSKKFKQVFLNSDFYEEA